MDGHAVLASLRARAACATIVGKPPSQPRLALDVTSSAASSSERGQVAQSSKRAYKRGRVQRVPGGKKDGLAKVRKRATKLQSRIGLRVGKPAPGGGLPQPKRKAVRRDAVLAVVANAPGNMSLKPASSSAASDVAWAAGVERITCGAHNDRFELLRRLTLGNLAFVASMPEASVATLPNVSGAWWRSSVSRGWQLRLQSAEIVIAGGRAQWRAGGAAGGGHFVVSATVLVPAGSGHLLGDARTIHQNMVVDAGVFYDWDAAAVCFHTRDQPFLFSQARAPASILSEQALPPLPQDTDAPVGAERLDAVVVLPLAALSRCASEGHSPTPGGLGNVCWVLDEPHPRAIRKAFYYCTTCQKKRWDLMV